MQVHKFKCEQNDRKTEETGFFILLEILKRISIYYKRHATIMTDMKTMGNRVGRPMHVE